MEYKKGKKNVYVDSLSKKEESDEVSPLLVTTVEYDWIEQVRSMVIVDEYFNDLNSKWEAGSREYQKKKAYSTTKTES